MPFPPRRAFPVLRVPVVAPCELGSDARQCYLLLFFFCFFGSCKGKIVGVEGEEGGGEDLQETQDPVRAHNVQAAGVGGITRTGITVRQH